MRNVGFLLVGLAFLSVLTVPNPFNRIVPDVYRKPDISMENDAAVLRRQAVSIADVRADLYRLRYEFCDEHHNCTNRTASHRYQQVKNQMKSNRVLIMDEPYFHVPVWQ